MATTSEILEWLAETTLDRTPRGGEVPTEADLAIWLPEYPGDAAREARTRLRAVYGSTSCWGTTTPFVPEDDSKLDDCRQLVALVPAGRRARGTSYIGIEDVHTRWLAMPEADRPPHPLAALVEAWQRRSISPEHAHVILTRAPDEPTAEPLLLARMPGVVALASATLEAVSIDGEPLATAQPDTSGRRRVWKVAPVAQGELFPAPRSLAGNATAGVLFEAVAEMALGGDERSPLRADLMRLALAGAALTRSITLSTTQGAILIAGTNTPANRARFNRAMWGARNLRFEAEPQIYWPMLDAEPGPTNRIGPARWWLDQSFGMRAWRLSGGLFRPATKWGAIERTIAGIEGALTWGASAGKGRDGRIPNNVRSVRKGGPGPDVFVPWWKVLRLAGEPCGPDDDPKGTKGVRYRARIEALRKAGYFTAGGGATATAGDTVEITQRVRGSRNRPAGLMVRTSARFCAAYVARNARERISATVLFK